MVHPLGGRNVLCYRQGENLHIRFEYFIQYFLCKRWKFSPDGGSEGTVSVDNRNINIYPLGIMNVYNKFHGISSVS